MMNVHFQVISGVFPIPLHPPFYESFAVMYSAPWNTAAGKRIKALVDDRPYNVVDGPMDALIRPKLRFVDQSGFVVTPLFTGTRGVRM